MSDTSSLLVSLFICFLSSWFAMYVADRTKKLGRGMLMNFYFSLVFGLCSFFVVLMFNSSGVDYGLFDEFIFASLITYYMSDSSFINNSAG